MDRHIVNDQNGHLGPKVVEADVIVVGAGFGGCYALHKARSAGYTVKLFEAGSDFGGVWHFNSYPGARVDSETPLYQLDLPEVWKSFSFRRKYPAHDEIKAYFKHLEEVLDLRKDAIFNARVTEAKYDPQSSRWSLITNAGHKATARYVIFATGTTNKAYIPKFPGIEQYKGTTIHPANWPNGFDVKGKKVGIIGQGASGLQILQDLAKEECQLTVFVRNPSVAVPMRQREFSEAEREEKKNTYQALFEKGKYNNTTGYHYNTEKRRFHEVSPEKRQEHYEELWRRGGFVIFTTSFQDHAFDKVANAELYQFWAKKVRARISDPVKRDIMAPLEQNHWIGTKRPSLETDYYEMIDRPNVALVDVKQTPIQSFSENGITVENGQCIELDVVVFATGYDSVTGSLYDMNIHDKNGVILQKKWKQGIRTYLGTMIPDMPNAFILYGPQSPSSLANGPPFLELQVDWVMKLLSKAKNEGIANVEPSAKAAQFWSDTTNAVYQHLLHRETPSWWNGSNIPGKKQEPLIWFGGLQAWREWCDKGLEDWSQFVVSGLPNGGSHERSTVVQ